MNLYEPRIAGGAQMHRFVMLFAEMIIRNRVGTCLSGPWNKEMLNGVTPVLEGLLTEK